MKKINLILALSIAAVVLLSACSKEVLDKFPGNGNNGNGKPTDTTKVPVPNIPNKPIVDSIAFNVKVAIKVGELMYDSIPGNLEIRTWDSNMVIHQSSLKLSPGTNKISIPKSHQKVQLNLEQWGISDEKIFSSNEIAQSTVIVMGGSRQAKLLKKEESFRFIQGTYYPSARSVYHYNSQDKVVRVDNYNKLPEFMELQLVHYNQYAYAGNNAVSIKMFNPQHQQVATTEFTYDGQGRVVNMSQDSYGNKTFGSVEYSYADGYGDVTLDYLYDNGHALEYKMKFAGGNKISDAAVSSTGGGEGGTYSYDHYINPFIHMNLPSLYFANMSKNNMIGQQKGFGGNIPSAVPYKFEYRYDSDGYPIELEKSFKSHVTGEHLYKIKTVYTY